MERKCIKNTLHPLFKQAWELYEAAFPPDERRHLESQRKIMTRPTYHFEVITHEHDFIGILLWWKFKDMRYIEHLSTLPDLRGQGHGQRILETFVAESDTPVWLEVEHPTDDIKTRRIGFYQRVGFVTNNHPYMQPPYSDESSPVPLMIMTYPEAVAEPAVRCFCTKYHPLLTDYA